MFFFKKEKNKINDIKLKEHLADTALSTMEKGTDYEELSGLKLEFGYLFDIKGHGLEAIFKITTDLTTAYFAVQGEKLMRLNIEEGYYKATVESFLMMHR